MPTPRSSCRRRAGHRRPAAPGRTGQRRREVRRPRGGRRDRHLRRRPRAAAARPAHPPDHLARQAGGVSGPGQTPGPAVRSDRPRHLAGQGERQAHRRAAGIGVGLLTNGARIAEASRAGYCARLWPAGDRHKSPTPTSLGPGCRKAVADRESCRAIIPGLAVMVARTRRDRAGGLPRPDGINRLRGRRT